jgi:CRP-like cAMP-binding protein
MGGMNALKFGTANLEWFLGLEPPEIDLILAAAKLRRFPAGSVMTLQGDPADRLMMMWTGRAHYSFETPNGEKVILMWIRPGEVFGASALASRPSTYLTNTQAVRDSTVLVWERSEIRSLAKRFPQLLENAILIAVDYFSWYVTTHAALVSKTAEERLAQVLFGLAKSIGQKLSGGIEIDVTNEEVANSANITPYTASRILSKWQHQNVIRKGRGKILLRSPERFFLRADLSRQVSP